MNVAENNLKIYNLKIILRVLFYFIFTKHAFYVILGMHTFLRENTNRNLKLIQILSSQRTSSTR
jgi:hypothetical protein